MKTVTHALIGTALYSVIKKENMSKKQKTSLFFVSLLGSLIPDIDVISRYYDSYGTYLMWHRGVTHSLFFILIWGFLIWRANYLIFRIKDRKIFYLSMFAVFLHIFADLLNAWGTGIFEPFINKRYSIGVVSYADYVISMIIIVGHFVSLINKYGRTKVFKGVWSIIIFYLLFQSITGAILYHPYSKKYEKSIIAANTIPGTFRIVGESGNNVDIISSSVWDDTRIEYSLETAKDADLTQLFKENPDAKILYNWSPIPVIIDNEEEVGILDPRFYRNGYSFLYEYIKK